MIPPSQTELSVIQGFQALLPCAAQGSPEPRVSWEKDGATVPNLPGKFTILRSGELIIERAEVSSNVTYFTDCSPNPVYSSCMDELWLLLSHRSEMPVCSHVWRPMQPGL